MGEKLTQMFGGGLKPAAKSAAPRSKQFGSKQPAGSPLRTLGQNLGQAMTAPRTQRRAGKPMKGEPWASLSRTMRDL